MIEILKSLLPEIKEACEESTGWDSLIINRRKPFTYRIFKMFGQYRICLHTFDTCESDECFAHPHPWPGAFLMLKGEYYHKVGFSEDLEKDPIFMYEEIVRQHTIYQITDPRTWHSVQPLKRSFTVMVNGEPWEKTHSKTRTTKGKDLEKMTNQELADSLVFFKIYLGTYLSLFK